MKISFGLPLIVLLAVVSAGGCDPRTEHRALGGGTSLSSKTDKGEGDGFRFGSTIAEIDLSAGLPEKSHAGLFKKPRATVVDFLDSVDKLRKDDSIQGVFIDLGQARFGFGRSELIARELSRLKKSKKKVVCYASAYGNSSYWVASQGCHELWLTPAGGVETVGIAAEMLFARGLLDKLGVQVDMLQVGKYKGTGETFNRNSASDEMKQSVQGALGGIRKQWLDGIREGRKASPALLEKLEAGPFTVKEALAEKLIDKVGYESEAREALKKEMKARRIQRWFGAEEASADGDLDGLVELIKIVSGTRRKGGSKGSGYVAVVRASGGIVMSSGGPGLFGSDGGISAASLTKTLRRMAKDTSVKAVVLRLDSPGGSALASDLLWHELMLVRKAKPLIFSIGDMAASGGYYMACAGNKIVAEKASIVGSIGVVGGKLAIAPALEKHGVHVETIAANPKSDGHRERLESPFLPWDDATRSRIKASMESIYDLFLERVSKGRKMPLDKVKGFAEGRIFSGDQAKELGMIDELGGLPEAIALAKKEAHMPVEGRVRVVQEEDGLLELLSGDDDADAVKAWFLRPSQSQVAGRVGGGVPAALLPFIESFQPLLQTERALVALPFVILVR
jgi:protease IV